MSFTVPELLQYANVLLIPAFIYIVKLERRIVRMETLLETLSKAQGGPAQLTG